MALVNCLELQNNAKNLKTEQYGKKPNLHHFPSHIDEYSHCFSDVGRYQNYHLLTQNSNQSVYILLQNQALTKVDSYYLTKNFQLSTSSYLH